MARNLRIPLRVVFYREDGEIVAHCLEFNLLGFGQTYDEALQMLHDAIATQLQASIDFANPSNLFNPAEGKYFEMFAAGHSVAVGELNALLPESDLLHLEIERTDCRDYDSAALALV